MFKKLVLILTIFSLTSLPSLATHCPSKEHIAELARQNFHLLLHEDNYCFNWHGKENICRTKWKFMPWHHDNDTDTYKVHDNDEPLSPSWYHIYKNPCSYVVIPPKTKDEAYLITFGQPITE